MFGRATVGTIARMSFGAGVVHLRNSDWRLQTCRRSDLLFILVNCAIILPRSYLGAQRAVASEEEKGKSKEVSLRQAEVQSVILALWPRLPNLASQT